MSSKFFYHTTRRYSKGDLLKTFVNDTATWDWIPYFHRCTNFSLIESSLKDDNFISELDKKFNGKLALFQVPPHTFYAWHKDRDLAGHWCFNTTLDTYHCHTLFETRIEHNLLRRVEELKYNPLQWTIFNTQETHTVINLDDRDRLLLTYRAGLEGNKFTYQDVVDWYKAQYE